MRVELIFVDSKEQTKRGFLRGFVALALLILPIYWLLMVTWWQALIIAILLSSALAVAHPATLGIAAAYGALVGLTIFGTVWATGAMSAESVVACVALAAVINMVIVYV